MPLNERERAERIRRKIDEGAAKLKHLEEIGSANNGKYNLLKREVADAERDMANLLRIVKSSDIRSEYSRYLPRSFTGRMIYSTLETIGLY